MAMVSCYLYKRPTTKVCTVIMNGGHFYPGQFVSWTICWLTQELFTPWYMSNPPICWFFTQPFDPVSKHSLGIFTSYRWNKKHFAKLAQPCDPIVRISLHSLWPHALICWRLCFMPIITLWEYFDLMSDLIYITFLRIFLLHTVRIFWYLCSTPYPVRCACIFFWTWLMRIHIWICSKHDAYQIWCSTKLSKYCQGMMPK